VGCKSAPRAEPSATRTKTAAKSAASAAPAAKDDSFLQPIVRGSPIGLELCTLVVREDAPSPDTPSSVPVLGAGRIARVLLPYTERPVPAPAETLALWSRHGLRAVSVPLNDLDDLLAELRDGAGSRVSHAGPAAASQREWLGLPDTWSEVVRGPDLTRGLTVALESERLRLEPGRLRLLVRGWPIPVADDGQLKTAHTRAALAVEVLPQHLPRDPARRGPRASPRDPFAEASIDAESDGLTFSRLLLPLTLQSSQAVILVSERPGLGWDDVARDAGAWASRARAAQQGATSTRASPGIGQVTRGAPPDPDAELSTSASDAALAAPAPMMQGVESGPAAPRMPTLGEALLGPTISTRDVPSTDKGETAIVPPPPVATRVLIILIPPLPERFELTP
jgi:hypothetical protein